MSETNNVWPMVVTAAGSFVMGIALLFKVKGASDVKMKNVEKDIEEQKERIDNRVHVNDFESHKKLVRTTFTDYQKLMDVKFDYIKEALGRIEGTE